MFITSILKVEKKETVICKKKSYIFKYLKSKFQVVKTKGPIQVLASALEKRNYINLAFETNANNSKKECTQKN
jgi:hypothetical protein